MGPRAILVLGAALVLAGCGSSSAGSSATPTPASGGGALTSGGVNHVHSIAVMPTNPRVVYLGGHYHLEKSTDGGHTWHPLLTQMMLSLAVDPAHPDTIYGVSLKEGVIKSTDGGVHWASTASHLTSGQAVGVAVDPTGRTVYAFGSGVYRSSDGGAHWTHDLSGDTVESFAVGAGNTLYAASGNGLYVSQNGGGQWHTEVDIGTQPVLQVAATGNTAYASTATVALYKSIDGGRNWFSLNKAPFGIEILTVAPGHPNDVLAQIAQRGFFVSQNGGYTWQKAKGGINSGNFEASTARLAPSSPNIAYTGSWGIHVYTSHDGGVHWSQSATITR